ncbi:glycosyltransferase family 2 protein [Vibrio sp. S17_S38]|uniref:glycosyltransferase family A protein n=1 Tax=Vibrio sp. S17_S38 TaxID=2720229 RepID=UPI001680A483|nr:glycosyltransferase family A protein [Vibrio sp. S17_S38]MBD1573267.1 glycosyltransferase family 2 protein [Vibrio sp. S17_S38]
MSFNVPVVLFVFKRTDTLSKIIKVISKVKPNKIYILSDNGRTDEEKEKVLNCREIIERSIDWECDVIKHYHEANVGVYENIALGAKFVFSKEPCAIFLEDDNLPEISFFEFCQELLDKYKYDSRVLWICGSNYLEEIEPRDGSSYVFSQNMLPCGWASWSDKFNTYYDGELELWESDYIRNRIKNNYIDKKLYYQDRYNIEYELEAKKKTGRFFSWDYQMSFSMRAHNVYAIIPKYNQIRNIGVDIESTHGGTCLKDEMVARFCERKTKPMVFPLIHPKGMLTDLDVERKIGNIILDPKFYSFKSIASRMLRQIFNIDKTVSVSEYIKMKVYGK